MLEHPQDREGADFVASVVSSRRKRVNWSGIIGVLGPELTAAFVHWGPCSLIRLHRRGVDNSDATHDGAQR